MSTETSTYQPTAEQQAALDQMIAKATGSQIASFLSGQYGRTLTAKEAYVAAALRAERERRALAAQKRRQSEPATAAQVAYIMRLLTRSSEPGFMTGPTTREGVAAMSKADASAYIDSLTGRY